MVYLETRGVVVSKVVGAVQIGLGGSEGDIFDRVGKRGSTKQGGGFVEG